MVCQRHDVHCNCRYPTKGQNHAESWTTHTSCTKSLSADPWHSDHSRQTCIELTKWPAGSVNADPNSNGDNCIQQCTTGHIAPCVEEHKAKASTCCCFQSRAKLHTHAVCALDCFSLDVLGQIQTGIDDLMMVIFKFVHQPSRAQPSNCVLFNLGLLKANETQHGMARQHTISEHPTAELQSHHLNLCHSQLAWCGLLSLTVTYCGLWGLAYVKPSTESHFTESSQPDASKECVSGTHSKNLDVQNPPSKTIKS